MSNALDWLRAKATINPKLSTTVEWEGKTYRSEWTTFRGKLPYRMRKELAKAVCTKTELEHETLRIECSPSGHQTGMVDYSHVRYSEI